MKAKRDSVAHDVQMPHDERECQYAHQINLEFIPSWCGSFPLLLNFLGVFHASYISNDFVFSFFRYLCSDANS